MLHDDYNEKIDRFTHGIIWRKVRQLIGRAGFTQQDRKDLQQDLILRVLQSLRSFDSSKAHRNKFVTAVVERHVANILRNKRAEKRDCRDAYSLNVVIGEEDERLVELADMIGQCELDARLGRHPRNDEDLKQLAQDAADVMATLPEELRDLAERLKTDSLSEIARGKGIPRTTLHASVRRLRQRFEQAGLKDYL